MRRWESSGDGDTWTSGHRDGQLLLSVSVAPNRVYCYREGTIFAYTYFRSGTMEKRKRIGQSWLYWETYNAEVA